MEEAEIIQSLPADWGLLPATKENMLQMLEEKIRELIQHDMHTLISLLYRMDVSEARLKHTLQSAPDQDAAQLIAALVIERQAQRIQSRRNFSGKRNDDADW